MVQPKKPSLTQKPHMHGDGKQKRAPSQLLPDVRDGRDVRENAAASSVDTVHYSQGWAGYSCMDN